MNDLSDIAELLKNKKTKEQLEYKRLQEEDNKERAAKTALFYEKLKELPDWLKTGIKNAIKNGENRATFKLDNSLSILSWKTIYGKITLPDLSSIDYPLTNLINEYQDIGITINFKTTERYQSNDPDMGYAWFGGETYIEARWR